MIDQDQKKSNSDTACRIIYLKSVRASQKPHFQQAKATICLWHKKKGKNRGPKEMLGPKPSVLPQPVGGAEGERAREGQRDGTFQRPPARSRERAGHSQEGSTNRSLPSSQRRQISSQRKGGTEEMASTQTRCASRTGGLCPLLSQADSLGTLHLTQGKGLLTLRADDTDPQTDTRRAISASCLGCHIITADFLGALGKYQALTFQYLRLRNLSEVT